MAYVNRVLEDMETTTICRVFAEVVRKNHQHSCLPAMTKKLSQTNTGIQFLGELIPELAAERIAAQNQTLDILRQLKESRALADRMQRSAQGYEEDIRAGKIHIKSDFELTRESIQDLRDLTS